MKINIEAKAERIAKAVVGLNNFGLFFKGKNNKVYYLDDDTGKIDESVEADWDTIVQHANNLGRTVIYEGDEISIIF